MSFDKTKMYGLLHEANGVPVERQVRILKVGIGVPSGPDVHVWINTENEWCIETGVYADKKRSASVRKFKLDARDEAFTYYVAQRKNATTRLYPRKCLDAYGAYFTFLRMGAAGNFVHDFDAIAEHGPTPREIDIVFMSNNPFQYRFAWYTAAELKCEGNGLDASRRNSLAVGEHQKKLAAVAEANGEKFFPLVAACYTKGCPYPRPRKLDDGTDYKPECKPHGRLFFQLASAPRLGGTVTFDTTGYRSISQLFSCIEQIKAATGRGDASQGHIAGLKLLLVLRPYKVAPGGKPSTQYGVSLEARAEDAVQLIKELNAASNQFQAALLQAPPLQIETTLEENDPDDAAAMSAEFHGPFDQETFDDEDESVIDGLAPDAATPLKEPQRKSETKTRAKKIKTADTGEKKKRRTKSTSGAPAPEETEANAESTSTTPASSTEPAETTATSSSDTTSAFVTIELWQGSAKAAKSSDEPDSATQIELRALGSAAGIRQLNAQSIALYKVGYDELSPKAVDHFKRWLKWKATQK